MLMLILIGLCSGVLSGMGIGGGTLLIPALTIFCGLAQQEAQAINLIYFVPTAIIALITHRKQGTLELQKAKAIIPLGLLSAAVGAWLAVALQADVLRRAFGAFLVLMAVGELRKKE